MIDSDNKEIKEGSRVDCVLEVIVAVGTVVNKDGKLKIEFVKDPFIESNAVDPVYYNFDDFYQIFVK